MPFSNNPFYSDAHFCRYYNAGVCSAFYDTSTSRSNPFVVSTLVNRLGDICQTGVDATNIDFFSLLLTNWVERIDTSSLELQMNVTATLKTCTSISSEALSLRGNDVPVEIKYVSGSTTIKLENDGSTVPSTSPSKAPSASPTNVPTASGTLASTSKKDRDMAIAISVASSFVTIIFLFLIVWKYRREKNKKQQQVAPVGTYALVVPF